MQVTNDVEAAIQHAEKLIDKLNLVSENDVATAKSEMLKSLNELILGVEKQIKAPILECFKKLENIFQAEKAAALSALKQVIPQSVLDAQAAVAALASHFQVTGESIHRFNRDAEYVGKVITSDILPFVDALRSSMKTLCAPDEKPGPSSSFFAGMLGPRKADEKPDLKKKGIELRDKLKDLGKNVESLLSGASRATAVLSMVSLEDLGLKKALFAGLDELSKIFTAVKDALKSAAASIAEAAIEHLSNMASTIVKSMGFTAPEVAGSSLLGGVTGIASDLVNS